jgi:predicted MPP superfamily phosphohydrolase
LNLARFLTPYVYGHYQRERSHLYVTRGIGTVGVPARIGAPPEVALIRLCAT